MRSNYLIIIVLFFPLPSVSQTIDKIKPDLYFSLKTEYNDNIFFEKEPQTEFITTINPGVNIKMIAAKWLEEIDYSVRFLDYRNIKQKKLNHNLNIKGGHKLSNKLFFLIEGNLLENKEETLEEDFSVTKREYLKQKIATSIKFQIKPRLESKIKCQYEDFDVREEEFSDNKEKDVFFDIYYTLSERLKIMGVYQYKKREFKTYKNLNLDLLGIGITYELSPRVNNRLIVKHERRTKDDEEGHVFAFQANLNREINKKTTLSLLLENATEFTRSMINYVEIKTAKIDISRELNKKTKFFSSIDFKHGYWQDTSRKDKLRLLNSGLSHQMSKDISFTITYNYLDRKSNLFDVGIKNNTYIFSLQWR